MIIQDWLIGLDQGLVNWLMIVRGARLAKKNRNLHSLFSFPFLNLAINTFPSTNGTSFCKRTPNGHAFRMREISHCFDNFRIWSSCKKHQVHVQVDLLRIKLVILFKRQATVQSPLSFNHPTPKVKWLHELWKKLVFDHKENASTSSYYLVSIDIWILTNSTNGFHLS